MNAIIRISSVEFTEAFFLKQKELLGYWSRRIRDEHRLIYKAYS